MSIHRLPLLLFILSLLIVPMAQAADTEKVDINTADAWSLARILQGVGPKKAAAIVDFREKNGPFKSIYDLDEVYGIGPKTIDKNQDRIIVSVPEESSEQESEK
jgi:competence protein ComEA